MIYEILLVDLCLLLAYILYSYVKIHYHFKVAGVKYLPGVPLFGNVWRSTFLRRHFLDDLAEVYNAFPEEKYVGFADGMVPVILVRDPEVIKTITIKDFEHFRNRKQFKNKTIKYDPLLGRNLLKLQDNEWKATRAQLTPAFTAARLRYMLPGLNEVSKNIVSSLRDSISKDVDLTDPMYRYTGDSIAFAAFGFDQANSIKEDSVFFKFGASIRLNFWRRFLIFLSVQFPKVAEIFRCTTGLQIFPKKTHGFLKKAVCEALEYRKKKSLSISDYMDVLQKMSDEKPVEDLAGQFFFAFAASLESGSGILRLCFHELVLNPDIQERLYQELRDHLESGEMTMESIGSMKYLDCVLNETSRRWSAAIIMDRICTKPYVLPPPREGGKTFSVPTGHAVYNVVNAIHMDPKYHTNPEIFDPERFAAENKKSISSGTFMPFGMGPRGCLGGRFATLQIKVMIYHMILNFKLVKCEKTTYPIQLQPDEMNIKVKGGTWAHLELREPSYLI